MHASDIFNWLSVTALIFMSWGIVEQWRQIRRRANIQEINIREVAIRWIITGVLLVKMLFVGDPYLITGQVLLLCAISLYFGTLILIEKNNHE